MLTARQQIRENFAATLRERLRTHHRGTLPSAAAFAIHFNVAVASADLQISQETARRWLRGASLPDETRMLALADWLDINLHEALSRSQIILGLALHRDGESQAIIELIAAMSQDQRQATLAFLKRIL